MDGSSIQPGGQSLVITTGGLHDTMGVSVQQFAEGFKSRGFIFELMMILRRINHIEDIF
jgi:hypothetical protein